MNAPLRSVAPDAPPKAAWLEHRERGSVAALRFGVWVARALGRRVARLFLFPACLYFIATGSASRAASRDYLTRVLGRAPRWGDVFRQHFAFASTILDRFYLLGGDTSRIDARLHGVEAFDEAYAAGRGVIMLGAHFGSFDVLRCLAAYEPEGSAARRDLAVSILMHEDNSARIQGVMGAVAPHLAQNVIALGQPDTFLRVKEVLDRGEVVGLLADRGLAGDKMLELPFLGEPAAWPLGPMLLASILQAPVILFYAVYRGGRTYDIYLERFAERVTADRRRRDEDLRVWVDRYVRRLEEHVRDAPYNWFNFFDFWRKR